jgi:hypothetical protein
LHPPLPGSAGTDPSPVAPVSISPMSAPTPVLLTRPSGPLRGQLVIVSRT